MSIFMKQACQEDYIYVSANLYSTTCSNPGLLVFESRAPRGSQKLTCPNQSA
jgi:hypothetical protein